MDSPLNPRQFMYHVSSPQYRDSIRSKGIEPKAYMSTEPLNSPGSGVPWPQDVWKVNTQGLKVRPDKKYDEAEGRADFTQTHRGGWTSHVVSGGVPPHHLELVAEANPHGYPEWMKEH